MNQTKLTRRDILIAVTTAPLVITDRGKPPCDIWIYDARGEHDCGREADFEYADATINALDGPRRFCKDHVGCATLALAAV